MNLPCRRMERMVWFSTRLARAFLFPRVTNRDPNSAARIRAPGRMPDNERTTVSTSGSSGTSALVRNVDQNIVAFDADGIHGQRHLRVEIVLPGPAIVFPGVPRARDHVPVQRALGERSSRMRAGVSDHVDVAVYVAER